MILRENDSQMLDPGCIIWVRLCTHTETTSYSYTTATLSCTLLQPSTSEHFQWHVYPHSHHMGKAVTLSAWQTDKQTRWPSCRQCLPLNVTLGALWLVKKDWYGQKVSKPAEDLICLWKAEPTKNLPAGPVKHKSVSSWCQHNYAQTQLKSPQYMNLFSGLLCIITMVFNGKSLQCCASPHCLFHAEFWFLSSS